MSLDSFDPHVPDASLDRPAPARRGHRTLRRMITGVVSLAMLALLVIASRRVNWHEIWDAMRSARPGLLLLATMLNLVSLAAKGARWWLFLRPVGARSPWLALKATFVGAALSNVAPANAGEAARVLLVSRAAGVSSAGVLAALTLERLFEAAGFIALLALAPFFASSLPSELVGLSWAAMAALIALGAFFIYLMRRGDRPARTSAGGGRVARTRAYLDRFRVSLAAAVTGPRLLSAVALTALSWGLQVATYHLAARAVDLHVSFANTMGLLLAENVGFLVRVTPGSVGVFQLIFAAAAVAMDLPRDAAVAAAVLLQGLQLIPVTLIGAVLAPNLIANYRAARRVSARAGAVAPGPVIGD